jgi:hypothetical protein
MIHYFTLFHTISHYLTLCYTESTETEHSHFCPSKLPLPLPRAAPTFVGVLVVPLPPHLTGCSLHLEGVMLSISVERASGKHVMSPVGAARASKRNNQTAKSSGGGGGGGSGSGSSGGSGSGSGSTAVAAAAAQWQCKRQRQRQRQRQRWK